MGFCLVGCEGESAGFIVWLKRVYIFIVVFSSCVISGKWFKFFEFYVVSFIKLGSNICIMELMG